MKNNTFYVGMDVHKATTIIRVLNAAGKEQMQQIVETKGELLIAAIKALSGDVRIAFEEGTQANWLYELLKPYASEIVVCNAQCLVKPQSGNKNDLIDAYRLADALRQGAIKSVYKGDASFRTLKELAHSYQCLVEDCTRVKNRIKAIFRGRAIKCDGEKVYQTKEREHYLTHLSEAGVQQRVKRLYQELDLLTDLCGAAEKDLIKEARKQTAYQLIDSVPQLGPIRTSLILAAVMTPFRFRTKRQFWAYCGLGVVMQGSSEYQMCHGQIKKVVKETNTRGLNRNYQHTLKAVFKAAANSVHRGPFKQYYDQLRTKGIKDEMARLSVARKIAATTLAIWKKGEKFQPELLNQQTD